MSAWSLGRTLLRAGLLLASLGAPVPLPAQAPPPASFRLALGFSSRVLGRANRSDVAAAMKAWLMTAARERKVGLDPEVEIFDSLEDIVQALRQERIDVVSVGMDDLGVLEKKVPLAGMFANKVKNKISEQFVLLARREDGLKGLADLRGRSILILESNRSLLAPVWLETELLRRHLPVTARHFGRVAFAAKPSLAIMPLFFKQVDTVLMDQTSFDTACELNPQLSRNLAALLSSPELVSAIGAYRADTDPASANFYRQEAPRLSETPGGRLILNLFQTDGIVEVKEAELRETRALLAEHARLLAEARRKDGKP
jgi:ABC-type phosphate/phosphonate transport system substrate-binding protein